MFKINEYFGGRVKSIAFNVSQVPATIGVMAEGEYEFGTSTVEQMTVTSGSMLVKFPAETTWKEYNQGDKFVVEANVKFKVRVTKDTSYLCLYE